MQFTGIQPTIWILRTAQLFTSVLGVSLSGWHISRYCNSSAGLNPWDLTTCICGSIYPGLTIWGNVMTRFQLWEIGIYFVFYMYFMTYTRVGTPWHSLVPWARLRQGTAAQPPRASDSQKRGKWGKEGITKKKKIITFPHFTNALHLSIFICCLKTDASFR